MRERESISSRFYSNSEAFALEFIFYLEEILESICAMTCLTILNLQTTQHWETK